MRYLTGKEAEDAERFCNRAAEIALSSKCQKAKHGAVIVKDDNIIGEGWNTPVPDNMCSPCRVADIHNKKSIELCRAVHAEHNAILDALNRGNKVEGSRMYHAQIKHGELKRKNTPSCTPCSRLIVHTGIKEFVLIHEEGFGLYDADEFNRLSYEYHER